MPKVICTRPNASLNINGVNFTPTEDGRGVVSDEISAEEAELFLSIDGYEPSDAPVQKPSEAPKAAATKPAPAPAKPTAKKAAPAPAPTADPAPAPAPAAVATEVKAEGADVASQEPTAPAGDTAAEGTGTDDTNVF
jgi:uncharacterized membrane protein